MARRVLLHGQVADALLATYGMENRDRLPELAKHYAESAILNPAHARLAASTLRRAAEVMASALGWDEAARLYERCLDLVSAAPDRLGEDEGLLWRDLAVARFANYKIGTAWEAFGQAAPLLESRLDELAPAVMRSALTFVSGNIRHGLPVLRRLVAATNTSPSPAAYQFLAVLAYGDLGPVGDETAGRVRAMGALLGQADERVEYLLRHREASKFYARGDFAAAHTALEAMRPPATAVGALPLLLTVLGNNSTRAGDLDRGARFFAESVVARRAIGADFAADGRSPGRVSRVATRRAAGGRV